MTTPIDELAGPVEVIGGALRGTYHAEFKDATEDDWRADAEFMLARFEEYGWHLARSTPVPASNVSECALCGHTRTAHRMGVACCDCSGFVPASNVSEGLHCPGCAGWIEPEYLRREPCPGALAHAAPEGLDVASLAAQIECVHRRDRFAGGHGMADWRICEHSLCVSARPFAALSQPDATEEAVSDRLAEEFAALTDAEDAARRATEEAGR